MSYREELFTRFGSPSKEAEVKIWGWLTVPENSRSFEDVRRQDDKAARLIAECEHLITQLREYRRDLAKRYNDLATMPSKDRVTLERYNGCSCIKYYIRHITTYADGTETETETEVFPGRERHAAIKRFEEIKKARPGIEAVKDIERKAWER